MFCSGGLLWPLHATAHLQELTDFHEYTQALMLCWGLQVRQAAI